MDKIERRVVLANEFDEATRFINDLRVFLDSLGSLVKVRVPVFRRREIFRASVCLVIIYKCNFQVRTRTSSTLSLTLFFFP